MTDTADPRIALMQKWSQENPELLAQAGLASAFDQGTNLGAFPVLKPNEEKSHYDILNQKNEKAWRKHEKKHGVKNHTHVKGGNFSASDIHAVAKAIQSGAVSAHGAANTITKHNKKKKHVKYYDLDPNVLSHNTEKARADIAKTLSDARGVKAVLNTYFRESDLINETTTLLKSYETFYSSSSEQDFEDVYSRLFIFSHKAQRISIKDVYVSTGGRFQNQDFHVYGPETRPIMQKAFIIKTLYHILLKRYTKTIPPIKKQTPQQSEIVKGMLDQFKRIDKPYKELYDYGRALRIRKAEAKSAKKDFPAVHNASLRNEFDDSPDTFSMATPYAT